MTIPFIKMSGSGNDFIIVNDRNANFARLDGSKLARHLCHRRTSIGADGLIFIRNSQAADIRMQHFNADGSEPTMCGNGARCTAFAAKTLGVANRISIETGAGIISAEVNDNWVKVQMPDGHLIKADIELVIDGLPMLFDHYDTGVPHAVTIVDDIDSVPVQQRGKEIRHHPHFAPDGANADFIKAIDEHKIHLRTYERGVEGETLACGTGAVAAALSACRKKLVKPPVDVITRLPDTLTIDFAENAEANVDSPLLAGKVILSFTGEVEIEPEQYAVGADE